MAIFDSENEHEAMKTLQAKFCINLSTIQKPKGPMTKKNELYTTDFSLSSVGSLYYVD